MAEPTQPARERILGTAELLDMVLELLPTEDLARASRVCTGWHDAITNRDEYQQKLFLLPKPATLWLEYSITQEKKYYPDCYELWLPEVVYEEKGCYQVVADIHPVFDIGPGNKGNTQILTTPFSIVQTVGAEAFICQPPANFIDLRLGSGPAVEYRKSTGITFGDLEELLREEQQRLEIEEVDDMRPSVDQVAWHRLAGATCPRDHKAIANIWEILMDEAEERIRAARSLVKERHRSEGLPQKLSETRFFALYIKNRVPRYGRWVHHAYEARRLQKEGK